MHPTGYGPVVCVLVMLEGKKESESGREAEVHQK